MNKDSAIYVAGSTGMVGSAIIRCLVQKGYTSIISSKQNWHVNLTNQADVDWYVGNFLPEYIFLAGAKVGGVKANSTYPGDFIYNNLAIQTNVIEAARKYGVKKLLFLGSSCIYSIQNDGVMRESDLLSGPLEPTNEAYAIAKIAGIKMCQAYHKQYGCNFISVMPTNLFGNNDRYDPETSHVMPAMIKRFHDAKVQNLPEVHCWGTGRPRREFLHVDDCAEACVKLMEEYDNPLEILNIGSGEDMTIEELSLIVASAVGYQGKILFDHDHLDGIYAKRLDPTKIFKLGWKPRITIEDGIKATYADFLERLNNGTLRI